MTRPSRKPPPRTMTRPARRPHPSRGNGPNPMINNGSSRIETHTEPASIRTVSAYHPPRERGLDGKEPEHERAAEQPRREIGMAESCHLGGTVIRRKIAVARPSPRGSRPGRQGVHTRPRRPRHAAARSRSPSPWRRAATAITSDLDHFAEMSTTQTENPRWTPPRARPGQ